MAHITLPEGVPGIRGPMMFRPETAAPLNELVDVLLSRAAKIAQDGYVASTVQPTAQQ